jgi:Putative adhesin
MQAYPRVLGAALAACSVYVVPALAEPFRLEKQFDLPSGDRFVLTSEVGRVVVRGVAGHHVSIVVTSDRADLAERYVFRFEQAAGRLKMVAERKDKGLFSWFRQGFRGKAQITVDVPRATPVELDSAGGDVDLAALDASVTASSSGGGVKVADVRGDVTLSSSGGGVDVRLVHGALHLDSSGGDVRAESIEGSVHANSSGGSVHLGSVSGDIEATGSGGGIDIEGAGGRVKAGSSGGPVHVLFAPGNARGGDLDSSGGGVAATLDAAAGIEVDASSSGGSVNCDLPVTIQGRVSRDSLHGKLNGGGALLRLRSSGGGIAIKRL